MTREKGRLDQRTKRKRTARLIPSKDVIHTRIPWSAYASKGADLMPFWFCKSCHIDWVPVECETKQKRNETKHRNKTKQIETKRNKSKRNETDRNETKQTETKQTETKRNRSKRNETKHIKT